MLHNNWWTVKEWFFILILNSNGFLSSKCTYGLRPLFVALLFIVPYSDASSQNILSHFR